jgi:hypothetical protein
MSVLYLIYVGSVLHEHIGNCRYVSTHCIEDLIRSHYRHVAALHPHDSIRVCAMFGASDEAVVEDAATRSVLAHLLCSLGADLRFHELNDASWLHARIEEFNDRADVASIYLISSEERHCRTMRQGFAEYFREYRFPSDGASLFPAPAHSVFLIRRRHGCVEEKSRDT